MHRSFPLALLALALLAGAAAAEDAADAPAADASAADAPAADASAADTPAADAEDAAAPDPGDGPGTTTTDSGLRITHHVVGEGASPTAADRVQVHYHGTFPDGRVFDSSVERGQPASFPLGRVIPCWTEGLQLMKVGGKALLVCPPGIAYGARGAPPRIPPNATLHFEVELLDIQ